MAQKLPSFYSGLSECLIIKKNVEEKAVKERRWTKNSWTWEISGLKQHTHTINTFIRYDCPLIILCLESLCAISEVFILKGHIYIILTPGFLFADFNYHYPEDVQLFLLHVRSIFLVIFFPLLLIIDLHESTSADLFSYLFYNSASYFMYFLHCHCVRVASLTVICAPTVNNFMLLVPTLIFHWYYNFKSQLQLVV